MVRVWHTNRVLRSDFFKGREGWQIVQATDHQTYSMIVICQKQTEFDNNNRFYTKPRQDPRILSSPPQIPRQSPTEETGDETTNASDPKDESNAIWTASPTFYALGSGNHHFRCPSRYRPC
jgi:hypothetical protein